MLKNTRTLGSGRVTLGPVPYKRLFLDVTRSALGYAIVAMWALTNDRTSGTRSYDIPAMLPSIIHAGLRYDVVFVGMEGVFRVVEEATLQYKSTWRRCDVSGARTRATKP